MVVKPVPSVFSLNSVPLPPLPPSYAVPYRVLPDRINPADGSAPSLLVPVFVSRAVKLCRLVKPVPSVSTLNTVPLLELPPPPAVPYRLLPDKINPPSSATPSLKPVKLYSVVKPVPSVLTANTVPPSETPPSAVVPYRVLPDKINPAYGKVPSPPVKLCSIVKVCA